MTTLDPKFKAEVDYMMQYGGRCRDCADNFGTCPMTNLPCAPDEARDAIQRILKAITYGREHGYLPASLPAQPVAVSDKMVEAAWAEVTAFDFDRAGMRRAIEAALVYRDRVKPNAGEERTT